ncbi:MAG: NifB/NifX family molybdenum-iron cluster-binding protein [Actinobacteria bacterium]|nr:NifB/NifX family molybdenum-iron cluster-binding protein [Actinomycetota bacterium]
MKAAISSAGPGLDSGVDPRFGRCAYLILYDLDSGEWEAVPNANRDAGGGAGIRTAQLVIDRGAGAVVTGNIGPNAMQVLSGQVKVHTGFQGTVSEAVQALKEGRLSETASATVRDHAGMAGGPAAGGGPATGPGPAAPGGMGMGGMPGPGGGHGGTWRGGRGRGGCGRGGGRGAGRW